MFALTTLIAVAALRHQELSHEQLVEDVAVIQRTLPEVHIGFKSIISDAEWAQRCDATKRDLASMSGTARLLRMARLVSSLGVAHTWLDIGSPPFQVLPVRFRFFADGLFVYAHSDAFADLAGSQVVSIGGQREQSIIDRLGGLEPNENVFWRRAKVPNWCGAGDAYVATGLSSTSSPVKMTFKLPSGKTVEREIPGTPEMPSMKLAIDQARAPNFMRRATYAYQIVEDPSSKSLVLDYRRCQEDPDLPMAKVVDDFWSTFKVEGFAHAVVDLRRNGGGNSAVLQPFIASLKDHPLARDRKLFALIGNETFSSGMMNAVQLREAGAILVGEPTGGSPNSYGEQKAFTLPNSKLRVTYCTKFFRLGKDPKATTVKPDWSVPTRWADAIGGVDACLTRIGKGR